jgi:hypothetical protein
MKAIVAIAAAAMLAGCYYQPPSPPMSWQKPGGTQEDVDRAMYGCERDARLATPTFVDRSDVVAFFTRCMTSQGFVLAY